MLILVIFLQGACVENVLDSLVNALLKNPNRKFVYVEQACIFFFFWDLFPRIMKLVRN